VSCKRLLGQSLELNKTQFKKPKIMGEGLTSPKIY